MLTQCTCDSKRKRTNKRSEGYGLIDYIVDKLPEIHIPGYQFCGPGTEIKKRLARGDSGINPLDRACKEHDILYSKVKDSEGRREADKALISRALPRIYSHDAKMGERAAALLTTGLMGAKIGLSKIGLGLENSKAQKKIKKTHRRRPRRHTKTVKKRKSNKTRHLRSRRHRRPLRTANRKKKNVRKSISFSKMVRGVKANIKKSKSKQTPLTTTIKAAIRSAKKLKHNKTAKVSRILKVPKFGGNVLSIVPILSVLSAVGSIPGTTVAIVKAIRKIQQAVQRSHTGGETHEKIGRGLYLMRSATGSGFYLKPFKHRQMCEMKQKRRQKLKITALSNYDIEHLAAKLKIPHFHGVFMRDALLKKKS